MPGARTPVLARDISSLDSESDFLLVSRWIHNKYYIRNLNILYSVANHLRSSPTSDHPAAVLLGILPRDCKYRTLSAKKRIASLSSESTKTFWPVHQCQIQCKSIDNNWDLCQTAQVVHNAKDEGAYPQVSLQHVGCARSCGLNWGIRQWQGNTRTHWKDVVF